MRDLLYKALKISVDALNLKIDSYKNGYILVSLYEEAQQSVSFANKK